MCEWLQTLVVHPCISQHANKAPISGMWLVDGTVNLNSSM